MNNYSTEFFEKASEFIYSVPGDDRPILLAKITDLAEDVSSVETKLLKSPIKELKYKKYRLLFFINKNTIYFISGFIKKTQKTPQNEINYAYTIYTAFKK